MSTNESDPVPLQPRHRSQAMHHVEPPAIDAVAVIRSKAYIAALVLAAIVGIPISAIAYGFLALVAAIQQSSSFSSLSSSSGTPRPRGGRCRGWCCADC